MKLEELKELLEKEQDKATDLAAVNDLIDKAMSVSAGEASETAESTEESAEESSEETVVDTVELSTAEETAEETEEETAEEPAEEINLASVMETVETLTQKVNDLEAKLAEKEAELAAKTQAEKDFLEKFKALSVSVKETKKPEVKHYIGMTNGIGEL